MIGENKLKQAIAKLHQEINVIKNEYGLADVATDGLFAKEESAGMITGLLGGKGTLDNGVDLDKVDHGGIYYLPETSNYINDPLSSEGKHIYREMLTVVRNTGGNPHTINPVIYQEIKTMNLNGGNWSAYRIWLSGKWNPWVLENGKRIYSGSISVNNSTLQLRDNIRNFKHLAIAWQPYQEHIKIDEILIDANQAQHELKNVNVPDDMSQPNPSGNIEQIIIKINSGSTSLTLSNQFYYLSNGLTAAPEVVKEEKTKIMFIDAFKD